MKTNVLYYGDNLVWLRDHDKFPNESIDLIYLDPPFNSNADYNVIFSEPSGVESQAQLRAFDDTWKWDSEASALALNELSSNAPDIAEFISWLGSKRDKASRSMAAYLGMMATRLLELRRVLKPTGLIYLHCDLTAGHYLKIIMDALFGIENFVNEIIWQRIRVTKAQTRGFGNVVDVLLFYRKSNTITFHPQFRPLDPRYIDSHYKKDPETGRLFRTVSMLQKGSGPPRKFGDRVLTPPEGRHWIWGQDRIDQAMKAGLIRFTSKGRPEKIQYFDDAKNDVVDNLWTDISPINAQAKERLPYPTQKPQALLERIINASSKEDDVILDPFCGCGTTLVAAQKLNRRWIGIDITHLSIYLVEQRLQDSFGKAIKDTYDVHGNPYDVPSAQALWDKDTKEFELWALSLVGARPRAQDGGVDGVLGFVDKDRKVQKIVVQVKGGETLTPSIVRDLMGTVDKEKAAIGLLITLHNPTSGMIELAVHAKPYKSALWNRSYPSIQIRTIKELLIGGKEFDLPPQVSPLKKAARISEQGYTELML